MAAPEWWTQRRFGLLVHSNLATVPAWAPIGQYPEWYQAHIDGDVPDTLLHESPMVETLAHHRDRWAHIEHYDDFFPFLTFDEYDPDAWAALARDTGMTYAVMVAKHHDGLCWWDAPGTDRSVMHDGPKRNVLGEFAAACERADLAFGTYYSLLDWGDARYPSAAYVDEVVHPQVLDLVRRYGSKMLWGDGHWGGGEGHWRSNDLIDAARRIDDDIVVNDRWWSERTGVRTYEYRTPDAILDTPWEMRRGLGGGFGHNRAEGPEHLLTAGQIVSLLTEVIAKGGHLLLGVGPDASGRIPDLHAERLRAAGGWVRRHSDLVARAVPWRKWGDDESRYLVLDDVLHVVDVSGRGRFAALDRSAGTVAAMCTIEGQAVPFDQDERGARLTRPPRKQSRLPIVYRVELESRRPAPIRLFPDAVPQPMILSDIVADAASGSIVQLGEGTYVGPARIADGVTVRGLGPDRTRIDGFESHAVTLGAGSKIEHCTLAGGGTRIVWLPKVAVRVIGAGAQLLGCRVDGHIEVAASDVRVTSCSASGLVAADCDRLGVVRSTFRGMSWDCGVDVTGGSGHVVENCEFKRLLVAVRLTGTVGAIVRANRIAARWTGTHLIDTDGTEVTGNSYRNVSRAINVDGGNLAEISGNAVVGGDSGCVLQRGASGVSIAGNMWDQCRIGMMAWDAGDFRQYDNSATDLSDPDSSVITGP
ncbi:MAG: alpha-L-fucosidase [Ilumatobacteraceae bacterium]